jgi:ribosomal protein S18 acetylase RimI-like enzyme
LDIDPLDIDDLERAAARHWQAPETEPLGEWLLRAAAGFTGRANSALGVGDPGVPLPAAVTLVEDWYRRRALPPMIVVPGPLQSGAAPACLDHFLAERSWVLRPGPALVMTAEIADIPPLPSHTLPSHTLPPDTLPPHTTVHLAPEPDAAWLALYRYRGQDLPPIARTLLLSAPWQAFASIRQADRTVAVGRISVATQPQPDEPWGAITAVEVDATCRRQGLGAAITAVLAAAAADRGARRVLLQVETGNTPARALYVRLGFRDSHRYHYRVAPAP